jgi:hypothetical protein
MTDETHLHERTLRLQRLLNEALAQDRPVRPNADPSVAVVGREDARISVEISAATYHAMVALAARENVTMQQLCERMLTAYLSGRGYHHACVLRMCVGASK